MSVCRIIRRQTGSGRGIRNPTANASGQSDGVIVSGKAANKNLAPEMGRGRRSGWRKEPRPRGIRVSTAGTRHRVGGGASPQDLLISVIFLGSPTAAVSQIMAKEMDGDEELASSIVMAATFFSPFTLAAWISLLAGH